MRAGRPPIASFWGGGFEGADHVNAAGQRVDMQAASGHLEHLDEDFRRAADMGLRSVRESIGWRLSEAPGGCIDLRRAEQITRCAQRHGLQILWTLWHYGLPPDLCLHDDRLIERFARFAAEVARRLGPMTDEPPVYTPINEIGYLAWASTQQGLFFPPDNTPHGVSMEDKLVRGYDVKRRLVRAALAAVDAIREVDPRARFLHVEPLCHVVAPADRPELGETAANVRSWQWQAWDMLGGLTEPTLGGSAAALDIVGVNHYHNSQWELMTEAPLAWHLGDPRRLPLSALMEEAWQRYRRPMLIAETGHVGGGRADWLLDVVAEARRVREEAGLPLLGLCLYPLVDRPDWNDLGRWHESGLWRVDPANGRRCEVPDFAQALRTLQRGHPPLL